MIDLAKKDVVAARLAKRRLREEKEEKMKKIEVDDGWDATIFW